MPRKPKATDPYEIEFVFPNRTRELLFDESGKDRYTVPELLAFTAQRDDTYATDFVASVTARYKEQGQLTSNQLWTLQNMAGDFCTQYDELDKKFFEWYDARPEMQDLYRHVAKSCWYFYDRSGKHHTSEAAAAFGWHDRPANWRMFQSLAYGSEGSKYRELKREVVYDVGDQVVLRAPFHGSWRHDPMYRDADRAAPRIGMVLEHKDDIYHRSRGGKGSRLLNILWISTGDKAQVPERVIKKYRAPKE